MQRLATYVDQWQDATTDVWPFLGPFDADDFRGYLQLYLSATRTRLIPASDPEDMPDTGLLHRDPSQSIAGSRQHAVRASSTSSNDVILSMISHIGT